MSEEALWRRHQSMTFLDTLRGRAKYESAGFARALGNTRISIGSFGLFVDAYEMKTDNHFGALRFKHAQLSLEPRFAEILQDGLSP